MKAIAFCAFCSMFALAAAGLIILVMCVHYEMIKRARFKRFSAAVDAYEEVFGADATLKMLDSVQKTDLRLDEISQEMEKAVKAEKEK